MTWSIADAYDVANLSFAAFSILAGALDLYVVRAPQPAGLALTRLARVNWIGAAAIAGIAGFRSVAPPTYLYALVTTLFLIAALRSRTRA